jgi:hypothetical protein
MPLCKVGKNLLGVVADRRQTYAVLAEFVDTTLQLNELRAAERSPIRRAEEHQHDAATTHDRLQRLLFARLIEQPEIGDTLAHSRTELRDIYSRPRLLGVDLVCEDDRQDGEKKEMSHMTPEHGYAAGYDPHYHTNPTYAGRRGL